MKKREFIFTMPGNPEFTPVSVTAWDIDDAIERTHVDNLLPPGRVTFVNNTPGKPTVVGFETD